MSHRHPFALRGLPLPRLPRRYRQLVLLLLAVAALIGSRWVPLPPRSGSVPDALQEGVYRVERVIDGDTLVLANQCRVRLIGADTPETVHPDRPVERWGPEATEFTRRFVAGGEVRLEFDGRRRDKYERFLAHVWVDGRMLDEELIRAGLATATTQYAFSSQTKVRLLAAQARAQAARRGIWSP